MYKTTSIVVTHDLKFAEKIADKIILLYNSKIVFYNYTKIFFEKNDEFAKQFINGSIRGPIDIF
jgi:phospholipid/cholesterol/gamma-HCH transport system ATP-binding protein